MVTASSPLRHALGQRNSSQQLLNDRSNANLRFMGYVRDIREEAQNLTRYANELKGKLTDQHLKMADVAKEWQTVQMPAYQQNHTRVQELFTGIKKLME